MDNMLQKIIDFIKKETVLTIATALAVVSAFWVHPGRQYVGYIDWRVLGILLSLMLIVAGFQSNGLFDAIGSRHFPRQFCLISERPAAERISWQ